MSKSIHSRLFSLVVLATLTLSLVACKGDKKEAAQAQPSVVPMKVIKAEAREMPYWADFIGQISAVETVDVRARVAGFLLEKRFDEGSKVKKDELLFVIDPSTFREDLIQAQSGLEYNQTLMAQAQRDYERFKRLYEEGVVSRDEFESYMTQYNTYKAQVRENKAKVKNARLQLGYTNVYSPIDGVVGRVQVDVGNLVGQGENTLLATVSTVDPVYVSFSVSESDYIRAKRDRRIKDEEHSKVKMLLADGSEYDYDGKFNMVDRAIDPQTGTLGIRVTFPNPERLLRPGQYAKVRVLIEQVKDAVVIPARGILDTQGMKSVFKVEEDGKVVNQPVKLGFEMDGLVIITDGLKADDMVIVDGTRRVKAGMQIKPIPVPMDKPNGEPASMGQDAAKEAPKDADSAKKGD